jgi:hypothetical protein
MRGSLLALILAVLCFPMGALADPPGPIPPPASDHQPRIQKGLRIAVPAHHPSRPSRAIAVIAKRGLGCGDPSVRCEPPPLPGPRRAYPSHHPTRAIAIIAKRFNACSPWGCPYPPFLIGPRTAVPKHPERRPRGAVPGQERVKPPARPYECKGKAGIRVACAQPSP